MTHERNSSRKNRNRSVRSQADLCSKQVARATSALYHCFRSVSKRRIFTPRADRSRGQQNPTIRSVPQMASTEFHNDSQTFRTDSK
ncbi:hypothetical protein WN51_06155 [Melipona quadrifasciata]|uniref:Uncharacterized protein n=1 Tax=Melipona quadrifasciata TaxID=166423 RepID=A0A0N0BBZ3_9HYME|nr:hypothetical protein WN51_06155 [Melipona quadrifasciata]